ncbi:Disease resistance protein RFL1 [Vitis vinifera]|uniref:Disease resistance protein RFL1 n=1 Tax=Vitis vinifera TaxID=29760 RepID=A0A438GZD4_VITVI|nr:Disease resistance protein RFL1 [Vitis vinifera]
MEKEVAEILQRGNQEIQKRCLGCCPRNCWSSYKIGKAVSEKLVAVSGQIGKGHFDVVAEMLPRPLVDELPMEETVGSELAYGRICGFLKDPQVGIMGLYGMGGVGKTTLLKKINNDFLTTSSDFDVVIWDVVSKPPNIEKIQEVIWNKLQIPRDIWEIKSTKEQKAAEISRVLKRKKRVPPDESSEEHRSDVFVIRSAWTLFQKEVGEETLKSHPHIPRLAKIVAEECNGLPLALITLGRALAGEKDPSNWDKVIQDLGKFPAEISEVLYVEDCKSIELVLHHDHGAYEIVEKLDVFSRLKCLKLNRLPRLKSIYQHPLLFPSLEIIKVYACKSLRSLPFDSNTSNNNLKKIKGGTNWWNRLKWKDETIKDCFTPYFQVHEVEGYFAEESETGNTDDDMQAQLGWAGSSSSGNSQAQMLILRALIFHGAETAESVVGLKLLGQCGCDMGMLLDLWASAG